MRRIRSIVIATTIILLLSCPVSSAQIDQTTVHEIYSPDRDGGVIYAGTEDGLYSSEDSGQSWKRIFLLKGNSKPAKAITESSAGIKPGTNLPSCP